MVPLERFELPTLALRKPCSTPELQRLAPPEISYSARGKGSLPVLNGNIGMAQARQETLETNLCVSGFAPRASARARWGFHRSRLAPHPGHQGAAPARRSRALAFARRSNAALLPRRPWPAAPRPNRDSLCRPPVLRRLHRRALVFAPIAYRCEVKRAQGAPTG